MFESEGVIVVGADERLRNERSQRTATGQGVSGAVMGVIDWVDERMPLVEAWEYHLSQYWAPKNFNFWYFFGVLSVVVLVNQLLTGIWLTMSYVPSGDGAFASVEYIMRDVEFGWLLRYLHSTGASAFFVVVYLHMFRGMMYGSYRKPRELIWLFGMAIFLVLMAEGFMGTSCPGQHVLLGCPGHDLPCRSNPVRGPGSHDLGTR